MTRSTESGRIMLIRKEFAEDGVLIELYWNVNLSAFSQLEKLFMGINRTILECKFFCVSLAFNPVPVLIELYWNVNKD